MLGDTITFTYNAVAKVLTKINQDNFGSQYLLRDGTEEFRVLVRHATESAKVGTEAFERHNIELRHTVFATPTTPELVDISNFTIRSRRSSDPAITLLAAKAQVGWLSDANLGKLIAWQS